MKSTSKHHPILIIVIALIILFAGDRIIFLGIKSVISNSDNRFVRIYNQNIDADVVVLGNSRADRHFTPNIIKTVADMNAINLGIGGNSTKMSSLLLRDYLENNKKPKIVIMEATNIAVDPNSLGDMRILSAFSERISFYTKQVAPRAYYTAEVSKLFTFNSNMFVRIVDGLLRQEKDRSFRTRISDKQLIEWEQNQESSISIYDDNLEAIKDIIAICDNNNIEIRIVLSPYLSSYYNKISNIQEIKTKLKAALEDNTRLWDYTDFDLPPLNYRDRIHLNIDGITKFNARLKDDGFYKMN